MRCLVTRHRFVVLLAGALAGCNFAHSSAIDLGPQDAGTSGGGSGGAAGAAGAGGAGGRMASGGAGGRSGVAGVTGTAGSPSDAGPSGSSNPDSNCGAMSQGAKMVAPDILIVQDKSGSMNQDATGATCTTTGCSKWAQTTSALNMVVGATETTVNWGLKFFATGMAGCTVNPGAEVPVGPSNATAIATAISGAMPGSSTPTRAAMQAAVSYLQTLTDTNPKYILLATDGLPNCASTGTTMSDDSMAAEKAVADALAAGFPTFVVGIGNTMGEATLNVMAMNGGKPQMVPPATTYFYQVNNTTDLVTALGAIVGSVASCTFNLGAAPNSFSSNKAIDVFGDGTKIAQDPTMTDGWNYVGGGFDQIQFYGPTCDAIMSAAIKDVTVTYRCIIN